MVVYVSMVFYLKGLIEVAARAWLTACIELSLTDTRSPASAVDTSLKSRRTSRANGSKQRVPLTEWRELTKAPRSVMRKDGHVSPHSPSVQHSSTFLDSADKYPFTPHRRRMNRPEDPDVAMYRTLV